MKKEIVERLKKLKETLVAKGYPYCFVWIEYFSDSSGIVKFQLDSSEPESDGIMFKENSDRPEYFLSIEQALTKVEEEVKGISEASKFNRQ